MNISNVPSSILKNSFFRFIAAFAPVAIVAACIPVSAQDTFGREQIAQLSEPAIVRIVDGCTGIYRYYAPGSSSQPSSLANSITREVDSLMIGSGFIVNPNGYIVTNAHVVSDSNDDYKSCQDRLFDEFVFALERDAGSERGAYEDSKDWIRRNSRLVESEGVHKVYLPNGTDLNFAIRSFGTPIDESVGIKGKDVAVIKVELENAPTLKLSETKRSEDAADVLILGYPSNADFDFMDSDSALQVSNISGNVSSNKTTEDGVKVIQISASVAEGTSGGPVLNNEGEVIGIITFGNKDSAGTTSIVSAIPTSTVKEFVGGADGIQNERGDVDRLYREGLELFWDGNYRKANILFERVEGLFEEHSEVERLIREGKQKLALQPEGTTPDTVAAGPAWSKWALPAAALLGVGGLAAAGGILFARRSASQEATVGQDFSTGSPERELSSIHKEASVNRAPSSYVRNEPTPTRVHKPAEDGNSASSTSSNGYVSISNVWLEMEYRGKIEKRYLSETQHKLGRDNSWADLEVPNEWGVVSGRHAILKREGTTYRIFDGDGEGRTSANGLELQDSSTIDMRNGYLLQNGNQLTIGSVSDDKVVITFFAPVSASRRYDPTRIA